MLYVVAWPLLSEADDTALRRLRAQYHPREAGLIGPHFTLVFGAPTEQETRLRAAFQAMVAHRPFWLTASRTPISSARRTSRSPWSRCCPGSRTGSSG